MKTKWFSGVVYDAVPEGETHGQMGGSTINLKKREREYRWKATRDNDDWFGEGNLVPVKVVEGYYVDEEQFQAHLAVAEHKHLLEQGYYVLGRNIANPVEQFLIGLNPAWAVPAAKAWRENNPEIYSQMQRAAGFAAAGKGGRVVMMKRKAVLGENGFSQLQGSFGRKGKGVPKRKSEKLGVGGRKALARQLEELGKDGFSKLQSERSRIGNHKRLGHLGSVENCQHCNATTEEKATRRRKYLREAARRRRRARGVPLKVTRTPAERKARKKVTDAARYIRYKREKQ